MEESSDFKAKMQASKAKRDKVKKQKQPKKPIEEDIEDDDDDIMDEEPALDFNKVLNKEDMEDDEDWSDDGEEDENLDVEFEFYDPNPNQMMSVKALINGYMDGLSYRSSELAEIIVSQPVVGTMIGVEDEEEIKRTGDKDVLAFATLLNIDLYKSKKVVMELMQYIAEMSKKHNTEHETLFNILDQKASKVLLLVNERVINLSPQLIPTLHDQVVQDLTWVAENNVPETPHFQFEYVLVLSRCCKDVSAPGGKKINSGFQFEDYSFPKFEDYEFLKNSEISFSFPSKTTKNSAGLSIVNKEESQSEAWHRIVYLIRRDKYITCVANLPSYIEDA